MDRTLVVLPESVHLELQTAGVGSRALGAIIDLAAQVLLVAALLAARAAIEGGGEFGWFGAFTIVAVFVVLLGLPYAFEVHGGGRTPGKRVAGTRVVRAADGGPLRGRAGAIRSVFRLVEVFASLGMVAFVAIGLSSLHQRIGDATAGTIVIVEPLDGRGRVARWVARRRERRAARRATPFAGPAQAPPLTPTPVAAQRPPGTAPSGWAGAPADATPPWAAWDVTAISQHDLTAVQAFLQRRESLAAPVRQRLAEEFARKLRAKVAGVSDEPAPEQFLEWVLQAKRSRTR